MNGQVSKSSLIPVIECVFESSLDQIRPWNCSRVYSILFARNNTDYELLTVIVMELTLGFLLLADFPLKRYDRAKDFA